MPTFEKPPLETLSMARDRWMPLYPEHGRLEVDDSPVNWMSSQKLVWRIPVATVSALIPGPGTTITHAAIKARTDSNTPAIRGLLKRWFIEPRPNVFVSVFPAHAGMARREIQTSAS